MGDGQGRSRGRRQRKECLLSCGKHSSVKAPPGHSEKRGHRKVKSSSQNTQNLWNRKIKKKKSILKNHGTLKKKHELLKTMEYSHSDRTALRKRKKLQVKAAPWKGVGGTRKQPSRGDKGERGKESSHKHPEIAHTSPLGFRRAQTRHLEIAGDNSCFTLWDPHVVRRWQCLLRVAGPRFADADTEPQTRGSPA